MMMDSGLLPIPTPIKVLMLIFLSAFLFCWANFDRRYGTGAFLGKYLPFRFRLLIGWSVVLLGLTSPSFSFLLVFCITGIAVALEFIVGIKHSAEDMRRAESVFGKVTGFFGWTNSFYVATGQRKLAFNFSTIIAGYAILALFASVILVGHANA